MYLSFLRLSSTKTNGITITAKNPVKSYKNIDCADHKKLVSTVN